MTENNRKEEKIRKSKMMSEGGPVPNDNLNADNDRVEKNVRENTTEGSMLDEGGLGAEGYYEEPDKIAKRKKASTDKKE